LRDLNNRLVPTPPVPIYPPAMSLSRRDFLLRSAAVSVAFGAVARLGAGRGRAMGAELRRAVRLADGGDGFGPLLPDSDRILDLPGGFSYRIVSRAGDLMDDGFVVPIQPDGMATFPGPDGHTILVRNHELQETFEHGGPFGEGNRLLSRVPPDLIYDRGRGTRPGLGGTTTVLYDTKARRVLRQHLSLAGTVYNCAGGRTPWGTWISCEETVQPAADGYEKDHGWCFEVDAAATGLVPPIPLKAMGRMRHEACAVDAATGIVYLTEDRDEGLLYRFLPRERGKLARGGRLQALAIVDRPSLDTRNWELDVVNVGDSLATAWIDVCDVESPADDLRFQCFANGAARFARGEGMWAGDSRDGFYFCCTSGGRAQLGQVWRYRPAAPGVEGTDDEMCSPGALELFVQPDDATIMENADNITVAPWGDLIVCEDGSGEQFLLGITPAARVYKLARNARNSTEFAGATFSPDGSTLFVNLQGAGLTLAVTGPWRQS
jgi:hypothetical protein